VITSEYEIILTGTVGDDLRAGEVIGVEGIRGGGRPVSFYRSKELVVGIDVEGGGGPLDVVETVGEVGGAFMLILYCTRMLIQ